MVDHILGNYLVESGKISKEQLQEVLKKQDTVRVKLGLIAVSEGLMTLEEADEINRLQAIMDMRFGDLAVEKGCLTEDQVYKLLQQQGNTYLTFIQTLIDDGLITMEEVDWLLDSFKKENGYSNTEMENLKSDNVDRIIPLLLPEEAKQYKELICTVVRTMIRLIDRHVYVGKAVMVENMSYDNMVTQTLDGEAGLVDCLAERDGALLMTCSVFGQEEFNRLDADSLDAAGELLNCMNGLYVSALSREGRFLELLPPQYTACEPDKVDTICRIPIFIGDKGLYFAVGQERK